MKRWPHSPSRVVTHPGAYFVTAATYLKEHYFREKVRLALLEDRLLTTLDEAGWEVQQWAVFSNHYHFVGLSPEAGPQLSRTLGKVHTLTARDVNRLDETPGRQVWFQFRDTRLTYERSYLARLNYVRCNAVKHGLALAPEQYEFCSASWFSLRADTAFFETVSGFKIDRLEIEDDF
jgi:putative transposase